MTPRCQNMFHNSGQQQQSQRLVTFETFDQSDEETCPDKKKKHNDKDKDKDKDNDKDKYI